MATHESLASLFSDTADAIREKTGDTNPIVADNFPDAIRALETGGGGPEIQSVTITNWLTYTLTINTTFKAQKIALVPQKFSTMSSTVIGKNTKIITQDDEEIYGSLVTSFFNSDTPLNNGSSYMMHGSCVIYTESTGNLSASRISDFSTSVSFSDTSVTITLDPNQTAGFARGDYWVFLW